MRDTPSSRKGISHSPAPTPLSLNPHISSCRTPGGRALSMAVWPLGGGGGGGGTHHSFGGYLGKEHEGGLKPCQHKRLHEQLKALE